MKRKISHYSQLLKWESQLLSPKVDEDPTREAIMAMVEKDVAFSDVENRRLLMGFIKKVCQAPF